jgi:membrane protease YdiL (CAAX protease family)
MADNLPADPVLDYAPPAFGRQPRSSGLFIAICWLIILGTVGLEAWANLERASASKDSLADNATLSAIGHCIVGAHALTASVQKAAQPDTISPLISQMDSVAKSPADKLRVAIVCKEVESSAAANARLVALEELDLPPQVKLDLGYVQRIYGGGVAALSDNERKTLLDHEQWFGHVALCYGLPDSSADRSAMLRQAKRAFLISSGAVVGAGGLMLVAVGLIVLAIVLSAMQRLPLRYRAGWPDSVFLEAFAVYLVGFMLLSLALHFVFHASGLGWTLVLTIMLPVAMLWPVLRGNPWSLTRMELGWHRGQGIIREIACGLIGYLAALPLLAIMLIITLQLIRLSGTTPTHPITSYLNGGTGELVLIYFIACIWAPIFEETMFRGALFNHLRARHGWWISAGIVGLLFAAVHPQGWTVIPVLGGIGMVLCALREWRGSLIASMAAHALNNGTVLTLALLTSR